MSHSGRRSWWSSPRTQLRHILMLDDTPHSIALGTALGMFVAMTPTVGIQMLLVMLLSAATGWLFRFNRVAALIAVYVSNPLTIVPIYYFDYQVGTSFIAGHSTREDFVRILEYHSLAEWWETMAALLFHVGAPLLMGSLVVASAAGAITYPVILWLLTSIRREETIRPSQEEPVAAMPDSKTQSR